MSSGFWAATLGALATGVIGYLWDRDGSNHIGGMRSSWGSWPAPGELADHCAEIQASGLFEVVDVHHLDWEIAYDAKSYIDLLDTFSGHIAMEDWQRDRLYGEIRRRLEARPDHMLRRGWGAVLHIAQRTR